MAKNYQNFVLAGLSGFLLALAYPGWSFNLSFLVWISFIPLLYTLTSLARRHDRGIMQGCYKRCFFISLTAGLVYFLIIFRWFWSIHPLDTLGIQNKIASLTIVFITYVISSAGMAVFWGLFGMIYSYWLQLTISTLESKKPVSIFNTIVSGVETGLAPAALFVLLEYARAYGFGLLWAGSGTLLGPHWTLGNLAYTLTDNNLVLELSSYVGIYGISFLIILLNFLLFKILFAFRKNPPSLGSSGLPASFHTCKMTQAGTAILIILLLSIGPKLLISKTSTSDKKVDLAVIQTNQPTRISPTPKEALSAFKEQLDLLKRVAEEHPESQLIVFPEASDFFKNLSLFLTGAQVPNYFSNLFKEPRLIISGARVIGTDGQAYSRVFALDTQKGIIGFYDKRLLTPQGEFLSYPTRFIVNLLSKTKVSEFGALRELGAGRERVSTVSFRDQFSIAPVVCSELWSPDLIREITRNSDIIAGMTSYGVFRGSTVLIKQTIAASRFRAAENQKPLIAASNMGLSYAIDSRGNVDFITPNRAPQILTGNVALNPQKSWYNRIGDLPTILASLALIISFGLLTAFRRIKGGS